MDTPNSQKRSPRASAKSKRDTTTSLDASQSRQRPLDLDDEERYADRSFDHVARVRAAKEAAERRMREFGKVSEYDITYIHGRFKENPADTSAPAQTDASTDPKEGA